MKLTAKILTIALFVALNGPAYATCGVDHCIGWKGAELDKSTSGAPSIVVVAKHLTVNGYSGILCESSSIDVMESRIARGLNFDYQPSGNILHGDAIFYSLEETAFTDDDQKAFRTTNGVNSQSCHLTVENSATLGIYYDANNPEIEYFDMGSTGADEVTF